MEMGENVVVKATGRRARITGKLSRDRYQVEFLPELGDDPIDRDSPQSEGESGIYQEEDLQLLV